MNQKKQSCEEIAGEQLELQVDISYGRHREFMLKHGLGECRTVVDLGTGNGYFLRKLAADHPNITFHGIDCHKGRLNHAKQSKNPTNIKWHEKNIEDFESLRPLLKEADGIIMRYFLLHLTNIDALLEELARTLKTNAFLWIFDLDLDNLECKPECKPPHAAVEAIKHILLRFFEKHSHESPAGKKIRVLLEKNGFTGIQLERDPWSNENIPFASFKKFILNELRLYNCDLNGEPESDVVRQVEKFLDEEIQTNHRVLHYGMSMVKANAKFNKSNDVYPVKDTYKFFSHCAVSPLYSGASKKEQEISEMHKKMGGLVFEEHYDSTLENLRTAAARLLNTKTENLAFVKNTSEGMCMIANGFPFEKGDEIISYVYEYPANFYPWKLQERQGVRLKLLPDRDVTCDEVITPGIREKWPQEILPCGWLMDDLEMLVTDRTRLIAISHTQFPCGFTADLKELGEFCAKRGIDLVLDVAQSLGAVPVYPEEYNISAVVSSGWKWLMGPIGTGLMYTSREFRAKLRDVTVGAEVMLQGVDYLNHSWHPHHSAKRFEYSTSPLSLAAALEVCINDLALKYTPEAIQAELLRLQGLFIELLDPARYLPIIFDRRHRSTILSVICLRTHPGTLVKLLEEKNIAFTARGGYLRFAPHFYNTEDEIEAAASILNRL